MRSFESSAGVRFAPWVRSTALGWALGVPAIVLFAALAESLGCHTLHTPVGAGAGLAVGFFQARALRMWHGPVTRWFWSCFLGLTAPFGGADLANLAGLGLPYSLHPSVVIGGLVVGTWQAVLLRTSFGPAAAWVAASVLGWGFASGSVALADLLVRSCAIGGIAGAVVYLILIASGGFALALPTGLTLARLPCTPGEV
ncbi:MAG: hypothetical protein IPJ17_21460 [Holophagales bacterium]|nr:MAG: hypothetical protein IPJ17_21460 [Holophagales bacterium]